MHAYYPRSFLKLIAIGFLLVALPLIIALGSATLSIGQLADHSERAVYQAARVARDSRVLVEELTVMERSIRQYAVLRDETLLDNYQAAREKFQAAAHELQSLSLNPEHRADLAALLKEEAEVHAAVAADGDEKAFNAAAERFPALAERARGVLSRATALIDREVDTLRDMTSRSRRLMAMQLLALVPVALLLIGGFTFLIVRPIRRLDAEIRRLGQGRLEEPVEVDGPEDLRLLAERLDWMRGRLVELEEQKSRFLRHISHELKTPLTTLREGAELLCEGVTGPLTPGQQEVAEILRHNALRLQRLIEDLLDYNALRSGGLALSLGPARLDRLISEVVEHQHLALQAKSLHLELDCPETEVEGDAAKLRTVVDNLLSNAIKFSHSGESIKISLAQQGGNILLEVADAGPGIALQDRERIFDPFYQGQRQPQSHVKGTGLGLSIVKELVIAHHGQIAIVDGQDRGARFRITLPLAQPKESL